MTKRRINSSKPACSIGRDNKTGTCYTNEALIKLRTFWNARHPDQKITSNDPRTIWESLNKNLSGTCHNESCWLRQKFIDEKVAKELRNYTFAPEAPNSWSKNPSEWLSSTDIEKVMRQYEKAYPCFEFLGPSPIDYDAHVEYGECVWEELCKFNLKSFVKRGKFKIGVIFNLDKHYQPGSHWVSLFINLKKGYIFYFDSTGEPEPIEVKKLVNMVQRQAKELGMGELRFVVNDRVHQKGNNECGMYSLYAIATQLKDQRNPETFLKGGEITDQSMHSLRNKYFNLSGTL